MLPSTDLFKMRAGTATSTVTYTTMIVIILTDTQTAQVKPTLFGLL